MNSIVKPERDTQNRVIALFRDALGYRYLGNRSDRADNSNIDEELLADHLVKSGYTLDQISRAIHLLRVESENPNRSLYENNKAVYSMLRYGVPVKIEAGKVTDTVMHLLEPTHNARFQALMDQHHPKWRSHQQTLNRLPVRHESWGY
jgi:type I restriction enzyme R subunit